MDQTRYDRLLDLIFDLKSDITEIKEDTAKNTVNLELHMSRTESNEKRIERLEKRDFMVNGFLKISLSILSVTATVLGILVAIQSLL